MIEHPRSLAERAMVALHSLVGGAGTQRFFAALPNALMLPGCALAITAGDESRALDPFALRPFALEHGVSVIATWTDRMLSGHAFEIDVVLAGSGDAVHYPSLQLWATSKVGAFLVSPNGREIAIAIDAAGIRPASRLPYRSKADLTTGIAAGQALLHARIFGGSPFATPLPRNIGR